MTNHFHSIECPIPPREVKMREKDDERKKGEREDDGRCINAKENKTRVPVRGVPVQTQARV